jgi:glycosyltransferase involved in cell wall biosynthesis
VRILVVAPYLPYEGIMHAGGLYLLRHVQALTARADQVSLIVPGIPEQLVNVPFAPEWLDLVVGPHVLDGRSAIRVLRDAAYRRSMNSPPAPSAESLRSVLAAGLVQRAADADIVELHWAEYARFASVLRRAGVRTPIAVVEHDVDLKAAGQRIRTYATGYRRALSRMTAPLAARRERRGLEDSDLVFVFKEADEQLLREGGITTPVQVLAPWLDEPGVIDTQRRGQSVLFTGALWRRENEDGVLWFMANVWPQVRAAVPGATFELVGAEPSEKLTAAADDTEGVALIGEVPDLRPYYERASLFVAPLFVPGGLKFKVPQAMVCGLPVVATNVAAEGVVDAAPPGVLWAVTDDPTEMAAHLVAGLQHPERAAEVGAAAAAWSRDFYSFERSMDRVVEMYGRLTDTAPRARSSEN